MRSTAGHLDHPLVSYPFHSFWSVMMLEAGPKERCSSGEAGSSSEEASFVLGDNWNEKTWAKSKETEEETGELLQAGIQTWWCRGQHNVSWHSVSMCTFGPQRQRRVWLPLGRAAEHWNPRRPLGSDCWRGIEDGTAKPEAGRDKQAEKGS